MRVQIQSIEKTANRAQPALHTRMFDGWHLRFARGYSRRANSVHALYGSSLPVEEKIMYCENLYRAAGQRSLFKMTEAVFPDDLDTVLAEKGYTAEGETGVFVLDTAGKHFDVSENAHTASTLDQAWLAAYCRLNEVAATHRRTLQNMLQLIAPECGFLSLYDDDNTCIGVALSVVDEKIAGVFDVVIERRLRQQGYGKELMQDVLAWSTSQGAEKIYLQVTAENTAARALYRSLGFEELYRYWYRAKDLH